MAHSPQAFMVAVDHLGHPTAEEVLAHIRIHDVATGELRDHARTDQLQQAIAEIAAQHLDIQQDVIVDIRGRIRSHQNLRSTKVIP